MFFSVSKMFWLVAAPGNLLVLLLVVGALALFTRFVRVARALVVLCALGLLRGSWKP